MALVIPNSGTDYGRRLAATRGEIRDDEIHTTRDQKRVFLGNYLVGPYVHRNVPGELEMLALNTSSARGCFAFDMAIRTDGGQETAWLCLAGRGSTLDQWYCIGATAAGVIDLLFGGTYGMGLLTDSYTGGDFSGFSSETLLGGFFIDGIHGGFF